MVSSQQTLDPEQERLRKSRLWQSLVRAGTPAPLATIFVESGQAVDPPPPVGQHPLTALAQQTVRLAGLAGRAAQRAVGGVAGAAAAMPIMGAVGPAGAGLARNVMDRVAGGAEQAGTAVGLPTPETGLERMGTTVAAGAMGGAPFGLPGVIGGAAAGAGQQGVAELGGGPGAQTVAALLAALLAGKTAKTVETRLNPRSGAAKAINEPYRRAGDDAMTELPQAQAVARGNPELMGYETMGRPGSMIAQRVAQEGGQAAEPLVRRVADKASVLADQQRTRIEQLATQARQTFAQDAAKAVGPRATKGGLSTEQAIDRAYTPRVTKAYDTVRWQDVEVTPEMASLMDDPIFRRYAAEARLTHNSGVEKLPDGRAVPRREIPPLEYETQRGPVMRDRLPVAFFDETKKLIQRAAGDKSLSEANRSEAANILGRMNAIIEQVDAATPGYAPARQLAAEQAGLRDALAFGRNINNVRVRGQTRGQVDPRKPGAGLDVVEERLAQMSPAELATARKGRIYSLMELIRKSPKPWEAIGDIEQHAPFLDDATIGELRAARRLATETQSGVVDPQMQSIADRSEGAMAVLGSNKPGPMQAQANKAKAILVDILIRANRSAIRDLQTADQSKVLYRPEIRRTLAEGLSMQGRPFADFLDEMMRRISNQQTAVPRSVLGGAIANQQDRDRR